jgi:serine/threonine protein kinase
MQSAWPPTGQTGYHIAGRYRLHHSLGTGSFGEVFYAVDLKFEPPRPVAIKLVHRSLLVDRRVREDLRREAGILARFSHPHILRVLDFEISQDKAYIVTELASNGSLARLLQPDGTKAGRPLPLDRVTHLLEQISNALDEAHGLGLIHRDIKPENILLDKAGRVLLADFGLAMTLNNPQASMHGVGSAGVWGTAEYAAPEVWDEKVGKKSDIYALGVLVFQMLAGQTPWQGTPADLMKHHISSPVPRLNERAPWLNYPPALDSVLARAMSKETATRYTSAGELHSDFVRVLSGAAPHYTPPQVVIPAARPKINEDTIKEGFRLLKIAYNLATLFLSFRSGRKDSPETFNRRGQAFSRLELYGLAMSSYEKALQLDPAYAPAYRNRATIHLLRGDNAAYTRDMEHATRLSDPVTHQNPVSPKNTSW